MNHWLAKNQTCPLCRTRWAADEDDDNNDGDEADALRKLRK